MTLKEALDTATKLRDGINALEKNNPHVAEALARAVHTVRCLEAGVKHAEQIATDAKRVLDQVNTAAAALKVEPAAPVVVAPTTPPLPPLASK